MPKLDDTLLEHGLSHLHEAGDVGALHVVNMTVGPNLTQASWMLCMM